MRVEYFEWKNFLRSVINSLFINERFPKVETGNERVWIREKSLKIICSRLEDYKCPSGKRFPRACLFLPQVAKSA